MKLAKRILLVVLSAVLMFFVVTLGMVLFVLFGTNVKETDDIAYYRALSGEDDGTDMIAVFGESFDMPCPYDLPHLEELEPYSDYRFNYTATREGIFQCHAYSLIICYNPEIYIQKKDALMQRYTFLNDSFRGGEENGEQPPEFELDGFCFRAVRRDEHDYSDVQYILFIGTSDSKKEIALIYFHDQDLDYIDYPWDTFFDAYTGWNKVVNE